MIKPAIRKTYGEEIFSPVKACSNYEKDFKNSKLKFIFVAIISLVIIVTLTSCSGVSDSNKNIDLIKNGYLGNYKTVTISKMLNTNFKNANIKWDGFESDEKNIVEVAIEDTKLNKKILIQFLVNSDDTFNIAHYSLDGQPIEDAYYVKLILDSLYENYAIEASDNSIVVDTDTSNDTLKGTKQNKSTSKNENVVSNTVATNPQNDKKEIDLLNYIGKSITDIKKDFGNPTKIDGAQTAELYHYGTFYFAIDNDKVINICIKDSSSTATVNGIEIGMAAKDVKSKLGNPTKESNDNDFIMEYRLNANTISVQYYCNDFRSPVNLIMVTDLTHGKEQPMEVTKDMVESLIEGNWVLEKNVHEKNLSLYMHTFKDRIQDKHLGVWSKEYKITSKNTIMFHYMVQDISGTREEDTEYFIEFYEDGERMEIYLLDEYGDRDTYYDQIYCRYN